MSLDFGLENVHFLITGAAGGIGLETVKTFCQLGARVTAQYNSQIGGLASIDGVVSIQADVRDVSCVQHLLEHAAILNKGPVSILLYFMVLLSMRRYQWLICHCTNGRIHTR